MKKKVIAVLGLLGVMASANAMNRTDNAPFEIINGFLGMQRDVILHLVKVIESSQKKRVIMGLCHEHYVWKNHNSFIRAHLGTDRTGRIAEREYNDRLLADYNLDTVMNRKKEINEDLDVKVRAIYWSLRTAARNECKQFVNALAELEDTRRLHRLYYETYGTTIPNELPNMLAATKEMAPDFWYVSYDAEQRAEKKMIDAMTVLLLINRLTEDHYARPLDMVADKNTLGELSKSIYVDPKSKKVEMLRRRLEMAPIAVIEVVVLVSPTQTLSYIFNDGTMTRRLLDLSSSALRACNYATFLTLRGLYTRLFEKTTVLPEKQHELTAAIKWTQAVTHDRTRLIKANEQRARVTYYRKQLIEAQTLLNIEKQKPKEEQNDSTIKVLKEQKQEIEELIEEFIAKK